MKLDTERIEQTVHSKIVPDWLSFIFACMFIGGCVQGGCTGGFKAMIKPVVDGWRQATESPTK